MEKQTQKAHWENNEKWKSHLPASVLELSTPPPPGLFSSNGAVSLTTAAAPAASHHISAAAPPSLRQVGSSSSSSQMTCRLVVSHFKAKQQMNFILFSQSQSYPAAGKTQTDRQTEREVEGTCVSSSCLFSSVTIIHISKCSRSFWGSGCFWHWEKNKYVVVVVLFFLGDRCHLWVLPVRDSWLFHLLGK